MLQRIETGKEERKQLALLKQEEDRQRIRTMRSSMGISPLELFPEEIWLMIFGDETLDPVDRWNIIRTHSEFQCWLKDSVVRDVYFPLILKFDTPHFWATASSYCCVGARWRFSGEKCNQPLAKFSDLRCVSKSLRNGVDKWHEENIKLALEHSFSKQWVPTVTYTFYMYDPSNTVKVDKILTDLSNVNLPLGSRFYRRSLEIVLFKDLPFGPQSNQFSAEQYKHFLQGFVNKIESLLKIVGDQIWYFRLYIPDDCSYESAGLSANDAYVMLQKWLQLMANVKWVDIDIDMYSDDVSNASNETYELHETTMFPSMPGIQRISLHSDGSNPGILKLFLSVLKANAHVKQLDIENEREFLKKMPEAASYIRRSLFLEHYNCSVHISRSMLSYRWPLKNLTLCLEPCPPIETLFQMLNAYSGLERIILRTPNFVAIGKNSQKLVSLQLPNLKTFDLSFFPKVQLECIESVSFYFGLQFLCCYQTLEKLRMQAKMPYADTCKIFRAMQMTKDGFSTSLFNPKTSPIWDIFSKLERVGIEYSYNSARDIRRADRTKLTN